MGPLRSALSTAVTLFCVIGCAGLACSPGVVSLSPPGEGKQLDYDDALLEWTRSHERYRNFKIQAVIHATYFSPSYIAAYIQEYQRIYEPVDVELEALRKRFDNRKTREECFFVTVLTGDRNWNDLALSNSIWRVYVETDDGRKVKATSISEVKKLDELHLHFYPHLDHYRDAYNICFPRFPSSRQGGSAGIPQGLIEPGLGSFHLIFRSPVGEAKLTWQTGS
jgi:hypothetical protein